MASMVIGLLQTRSVNLASLAKSLSLSGSNALLASAQKRTLRFVAQILLPYAGVARYVATTLNLFDQNKWTLVMDRTNWRLGKTDINILYLSVVHTNVSIPLFFSLLEDKSRGNSDALDRIDIMAMFIKTFSKQRIKVLLADREFIGQDWIGYLQQQAIPFCIRIKEAGQYISKSHTRPMLAKDLFRSLKPGCWTSLGPRFVGKQEQVCAPISAQRDHQGELLVVMHSEDVYLPPQTYSLRWQIECMFKALKSGGFNLEDTHLTNPDRIETLLHVLSIAFCHAYDWGSRAVPQKIKSHGYTQNSLFRLGFDLLSQALLNPLAFGNTLYRYFMDLLHPPQLRSFFVR